jgi:hypothetical protein
MKIKDYLYFGLLIVLLLISLVSGIVFIYFSNIRGLSNDIKRLERISNLTESVNTYFNNQKSLPENIDEIVKGGSSYYGEEMILDPKDQTKKFEYRTLSKTTYEVCAEFEAGSEALNKYSNYNPGSGVYRDSYVNNLNDRFTSYAVDIDKLEFNVGRQCFEFEVRNGNYGARGLPVKDLDF